MLRLGLQIPDFTYPGVPDEQLFERVSDIAATAEESGFDSVWVMDHFFQLPLLGPPSAPMLEAYTLLSALAARTRRALLGAMVTGVTYRNPAILAKQVTTLDVISAGRAVLGIGAAWFEMEHQAYGVEFPPARERLDRLEEAVQICRLMFTQEQSSFEGRHYRIHEAFNSPRPVRPGGPPILIGGGGERRTLRLVAQYADACNLFGDPETVRHKLDVLDGHCRDVGRSPSDILRTRLGTVVVGRDDDEAPDRLAAVLERRGVALATLDENTRRRVVAQFMVGGPRGIAEEVRKLLDAGVDGLIFNVPDAQDLDPVKRAGEALAAAL